MLSCSLENLALSVREHPLGMIGNVRLHVVTLSIDTRVCHFYYTTKKLGGGRTPSKETFSFASPKK